MVTGLCLLVFHKINQCFISDSFLTPSSHLSLPSPPPRDEFSHQVQSNEEERKEVLVQSEMQMATEDMSTSQSGSRTTSTCQFIYNKSNATP